MLHADQAGEALALQEGLAHPGADCARRDHQHVHVGRVAQETVRDVVSAGNDDGIAGLEGWPDIPIEHLGHHLIRHQQEVVVGPLHRAWNLVGLEPVGHGLLVGSIADIADDDRGAPVAHVQRLRSALVAVAQDADRLALQQGQVARIIEVDGSH